MPTDTNVLTIRMPTDFKQRIGAIAEEQGVSINQLAMYILAKEIGNFKAGHKLSIYWKAYTKEEILSHDIVFTETPRAEMPLMQIEYPEIGICGLSCRLCPNYHTEGTSKCGGCKSAYRIGAGCAFITCAVKRTGIEFCWQCVEGDTCEKWRGHRAFSREHDTFVCYQKLEKNIAFIRQHGVNAFEAMQRIREQWLREVLSDFNEGRSKRYYCIAATVLEIEELEAALTQARQDSTGFAIKEKSKVLHALLNDIAEKNHYCLSLRK